MTDPLEHIRQSVDAARPIPAAEDKGSAQSQTADDPPTEDVAELGGGSPFGDGGRNLPLNEYGLPEGCPVTPLGKNGRTYYYLTPKRQIIALADKEHSQTAIPSLFSPKDHLLEEYWPRRKEVWETVGFDSANKPIKQPKWVTTGWDVAKCFRDLMRACSKLDVWKSGERLRGPGGWTDYDGRLIFHCGDRLAHVENGQLIERPPGRYDGMVYAADAPLITPYDEPVDAEGGPAEVLWDLFKTWNLARRAIDSRLLLGHVGCSMISGALKWRPMVFITADPESGKSTLQDILREVQGPGGMISTEDATEAGISAQLGMSCLPVSVDEIEAEQDNERAQNVIKLARLASSGGLRLRGSSNHEGHSSRALSCFTFSAVFMPPLPPQDRRRMAIIRLGSLTRGSASFQVRPAYFHDLGRQLKRRIADQWPRFEQTAALYRDMLYRAGHSRGGLDQYGTLMAMSHIMLHDGDPTDDTLKFWEREFNAAEFRETSDNRAPAHGCLDELAQAQPDVFKGGARKSVAQLVDEIVNYRWSKSELANQELNGTDPGDVKQAKEQLGAAGLGIVSGRDAQVYLAVPYAHRQVAAIYANSHWKAMAGNTGGWVEALSRLPNVKLAHTAKIAGRATRCLLVPVSLVLGTEQAAETKTINQERT